MSFDGRRKEVRFLSEKPTSTWGFGGWSLILLALASAIGVYTFWRTQSSMACVFSLCTEPLLEPNSTLLISITILGFVLWVGSIILGIFGCMVKSNTLAASLTLFFSLIPTLYIIFELMYGLYGGLIA